MNTSDFVFTPHNDMDACNESIVREHSYKVNNQKYSEATIFLDEHNYQDGFRASLFNMIQNKIRKFQTYLLNEFNDDEDSFYSFTEPTPEQMEGKKFWIQPY